MRLFSVLVLLFAIVISQGHPLSKSEAHNDVALPSSSLEPEKIPSVEKEKPISNNKPSESVEESNVELKPETPAGLDLKPQSEVDVSPTPAAAIPDIQKPANIDLERKTNEYDQRQNGTENYRIQVDGLVFVIAPVEALLLAGGAAAAAGSDDSDLLGGKPNITALLNPTGLKAINNQHSESHNQQLSPLYYSAPKPSDGPVSVKLINLIAPLLEQRRHFVR
ncbi:uncharacterized protein LOC127276694 [Leptopilina boulardi]|uniref:uncharacterized protein LOC127276694 n=1 Tax=Leptopilina boulardi TaxID=63433 RepID=UPI0021F69376|nr:uncharacterized protein LOC127276694 [Leptopilina boulardi]